MILLSLLLYFRDAMIVSFGNILTSLFAGFVIFAIIGYLAQELEMDIDQVVDEGTFWLFLLKFHIDAF